MTELVPPQGDQPDPRYGLMRDGRLVERRTAQHFIDELMRRHPSEQLPEYHFLLEHGRYFDPTPKPDDVPLGEFRACYRNAYRLAASRPGYRYVEGFGINPLEPDVLLRHAWCLDADGTVVDPTWPVEITGGLRGIAIPLDVARPHCESALLNGVLFERVNDLDELAVLAASCW